MIRFSVALCALLVFTLSADACGRSKCRGGKLRGCRSSSCAPACAPSHPEHVPAPTTPKKLGALERKVAQGDSAPAPEVATETISTQVAVESRRGFFRRR